MKPRDVTRRMRDPAALTPGEKRVWEYAQQGLKPRQIAEALGGINAGSVAQRIKTIRAKLAVA